MRFEATDETSVRDESVASRLDEAEFDSLEEVDAVVRTLRRRALQYALLVGAMLLTVPLLALGAPWWFARPVWGGLTLNFITVAVLLNVAFLLIGLAYNRVASRSEDEMLGRLDDDMDWSDV
ncbi:MAG TPA: hypothetical protein VFD47_04625 [Actinomycetota bacterium]|nr:hypothetical protein [Actinomycetota bacterium]